MRQLYLALLLLASSAAVLGADVGFDYFLLARQWGPTFCATTRCNSQPVAEFTIHGLWPNYENGGSPSDCVPSNKFSTTQLPQDLLNQMSCEWVSYTGSNSGFWSYEWAKHGTCALTVYPSQSQYFNAAIQANNQYDINTALTAAGIDPATVGTADVPAMLAAFQKAWGYAPVITCDGGRIEEIRQCLDLNLEPRACPSGLGSSQACSRTATIPKGASVPPVCAKYYDDSSSGSTTPTGQSPGAAGSPPRPTAGAAAAARTWAALALAALLAALLMF